MRDTKRTVGGLFGYASVKVRVRRNEPSSNGVSAAQRGQHSAISCEMREKVARRRRSKAMTAAYRLASEWHLVSGHPFNAPSPQRHTGRGRGRGRVRTTKGLTRTKDDSVPHHDVVLAR